MPRLTSAERALRSIRRLLMSLTEDERTAVCVELRFNPALPFLKWEEGQSRVQHRIKMILNDQLVPLQDAAARRAPKLDEEFIETVRKGRAAGRKHSQLARKLGLEERAYFARLKRAKKARRL
jgi:hypothetical protein